MFSGAWRLFKSDRILIQEVEVSSSCNSKHTSRRHVAADNSILMKDASESSKPSVNSIGQNGIPEQSNLLFTLLYFALSLAHFKFWKCAESSKW